MTEAQEQPHDRIFSILFQEDELTWQNIIYNLVRSEEMNPWDINITLITHKFLQRLKELKNMDFRISGKVVLASSMLLKMKSNRLLEQDFTNFDALLSSTEEDAMDLLEEFQSEYSTIDRSNLPKVIPKTPQPRKRKVSVFDLVEALEQALEVENRRKQYSTPNIRHEVPKNHTDISVVIKDVYDKIISLFKSSEKLTFTQIIPSDSKEDKVFTFIPLLHLENQQTINLLQKEHFGEIAINLVKNKVK